MVKLSDFVVDFLVGRGIEDIFMISGGGIIHLVESVGSSSAIRYYCNYNEQATTYCAEGYARMANGVAAALVTTGPGSTNALSGVASAWIDSVPMVVISGQVKRELIADYSKLRQIGEQEINIIDMVRPVTKHAVTVDDPDAIRYELEKALHLALSGRPGPVWINIPLDVQGSMVDERRLRTFQPDESAGLPDGPALSSMVAEAVRMLKASKRPVLLCGYGVRIADAVPLLERLLEKVPVPVLLSFNGMDLLADDHPLLAGKPGIIGQRRGNFALQNADLLLSVGSRMNIKIVGYNYRDVAVGAKKIIVDIDGEELRKPTLSADLPVQADAGAFLKELLSQLEGEEIAAPAEWLDVCREWKRRYPNIEKGSADNGDHVSTYVFFDRLSDLLEPDDTVVTANGLAALSVYQAFRPKEGQRVYTNNGYGAMGWGLPAAIGACIAGGRRRTVCVEGDGSLQMNIQELQLVRHYNLPLKIFVLNNYGYTSIRLTQDSFFGGHYVASDRESGVSNPDFRLIAEAYGMRYERIAADSGLEEGIRRVLSADGPVLCELNVSPKQGITPKTKAFRREDGSFESRPLEDMFPYLSREELRENMKISAEE